jgi:hypothetical protein
MASTLPTLNYTTPEDFVNYYYEKLKADLGVYDLQISKVGFIGFFLNLLGYTHFDLKQYYDSLFKEAFVGTSQTEESQYLHAAIYGYIPTFATAAVATGTIEFDMVNWLPRRQDGVIRREVIVGYNSSTGTYVPLSSTFTVSNIQFSIDTVYKFVEVEANGSYYYYTDITTSGGAKINTPSSSATISVPLYSTSQYNSKKIEFELKPYNYGSFQTYYFGIDAGYYLSALEVFVTEVDSTIEEQYAVKYTKYLEKGNDKSVFLRKITSTNYVIEFGSGIRGKWISGAKIRIVVNTSQGAAGNLIDKTSFKVQVTGTVLAFDYVSVGGQLTSADSNPVIMQQPIVNFDYSESGLDPLSGEDLRDAIVNYIQTRDNLVSQQDFYNIAADYLDDFKFLFKKFNVFDNIFHLCRSFRDRNQTIFYTTTHSVQVMNLAFTTLPTYTITAGATAAGGSLTTNTYYYFVVAIDIWGQTNPTAIKSIYVDNGAGKNAVTITWDYVPYATLYRVYGREANYQNLQYWEVTPGSIETTYNYVDDGTTGTPTSNIPLEYELQELYYRPTFTINSRSFISPFAYKGNTRMNYYDGYIIKDLARIEFSEITPLTATLGTGFDIPMSYLNLEYDESTSRTIVRLKSYQTISNLAFTVSIYCEGLNIADKRMACFPLSDNYFEYYYSNADTFGMFEGEIQIEVKGGISDSIISGEIETYEIEEDVSDILNIKFNDSSTGYMDEFVEVVFTPGSRVASQIVDEINAAFSLGILVASVYEDDDGNNRIKLVAPTGASVYNIFIAADSTCLAVLGLTGNSTEPAILNGTLTTAKFTCKTDKFYQLTDISDQLRLVRYKTGDDSYIVNIPVVDDILFDSDPDYYLDKIKSFITTSSFTENRMITDNIQCGFLNSYLIESPFIESIFLQSGRVFSNADYVFLNPVTDTRSAPPSTSLDGARYLVSDSPSGDFVGHANEIAIYSVGPPASWSFYEPILNDFVLDSATNIYYTWDGDAWVNIPNIEFPLLIRVEAKADKSYVQRNNVDIAIEKENLTLAIAEYLQKSFTGTNVVFYNSLITEFVHTSRPFLKSVQIYVTDSSTVPNELNNGLEIRSDIDVLKGLKSKLDIVKYTPPMIYWDVDNVTVAISIE